MTKILVSACLLGFPCRYDGKSCPVEDVIKLAEKHTLIPVCPEQNGGLSTPRVPAEIVGEQIISKAGVDVSEQYHRGAMIALKTASLNDVHIALLKSKSPSCGNGIIYDGTFTGTLKEGDGVTSTLLKAHGIRVYSDADLAALENDLSGK